MDRAMVEAMTLIGSLRDGDLVQVTQDGRTNVMIVSGTPSKADGPFGSAESIGVTITYGPGRYATRVQADNLVRTKRGHGYVGGGTELVKLPADACVSGPSLAFHPEHDYPADGGECTRCGAEPGE